MIIYDYNIEICDIKCCTKIMYFNQGFSLGTLPSAIPGAALVEAKQPHWFPWSCSLSRP